jgi:hypothetical protein
MQYNPQKIQRLIDFVSGTSPCSFNISKEYATFKIGPGILKVNNWAYVFKIENPKYFEQNVPYYSYEKREPEDEDFKVVFTSIDRDKIIQYPNLHEIVKKF